MAEDAVDGLADLVANSATWQTQVGAANATEAKLRVHQDGIDGPDEDDEDDATGFKRPFCMISEEQEDWSINTGPFTYGTLQLLLESDIPASQVRKHKEPMRAFRAWTLEVIRDIWDLHETGGYLYIRSISSATVSMRSDFVEGEIEGEPYIQRIFMVEYGVT